MQMTALVQNTVLTVGIIANFATKKATMKTFRYSFLFVPLLALLVSCSQKGPEFSQYLPENTTMALMVDVDGLEAKLQSDGLSPDSIFYALGDSVNPDRGKKLADAWRKMKQAGLDPDQPLVIAQAGTSGMLSMRNHDIILAGLRNRDSFETFIAGQFPQQKPVKEDGLAILTLPRSVIAWNDKMAIMLQPSMVNLPVGIMDSVDALPVNNPENSLAGEVKEYFNLSDARSLASNKFFREQSAEEAEIKMYTSLAAFVDPRRNATMALMPRVSELLEDLYQFSFLRFDEGKVVLESEMQVGSALSKILNRHGKKEINLDMLRGVPFQRLDGAFAFAIDPELATDILEFTGLMEVAQNRLQRSGLSVQELTNLFEGQFNFMLGSDSASISRHPGDTARGLLERHAFLFTARLRDTTALTKLRNLRPPTPDSLQDRQPYPRDSAWVKAMPAEKPMRSGLAGNVYYWTNSRTAEDALITGKFAYTADDATLRRLNNKVAAGFINWNSLFTSMPLPEHDSLPSAGREVLESSMELINNGWFATDPFSNGSYHSEGEMSLNTSKNALAALARMIMKWMELEKG